MHGFKIDTNLLIITGSSAIQSILDFLRMAKNTNLRNDKNPILRMAKNTNLRNDKNPILVVSAASHAGCLKQHIQ